MDMAGILNDPELREEINRYFGTGAGRAPGLERLTARGVEGEENLESISDEISAIRARDLDETEAIVLAFGRPGVTGAKPHGNIPPRFEDPQSEVWRQRLNNARARLDAVIPAIGRINVRNHPDLDWVGTGWLVAPNIIVTNRHVAQEFAFRQAGAGSPPTFVFKKHPEGTTMRVHIDFLSEHQQEVDEAEFQIESVLHIADESGPDIAFLRLATSGPTDSVLSAPVPLSNAAPRQGQQVAIIGYPARDSRVSDPRTMLRIFGGIFDVKRLAPGLIQNVTDSFVTHDCTTLGGNSGSAVIDLETGQAVALHFAGKDRIANYAVPAQIVRERLQAVQSA